VKFKSQVIVREETVLFYSLLEVGQKQTWEAMYLLRYVGKGTEREVQDKSLFYHFSLSSSTYKLRLKIVIITLKYQLNSQVP
jgi:hypothetical protein